MTTKSELENQDSRAPIAQLPHVDLMTKEEAKARREREIFLRFVRVSHLPFDVTTLESRKPPEPDILCNHRSDGPVAFELVEICSPELAQFMETVKEGGAFYMRTADPCGPIMRKKLKLTYQSDFPVELLCYTDGRVVTPSDVIAATIRPYLNSFRSTFRRAWLLSRNQVQQVWVPRGG